MADAKIGNPTEASDALYNDPELKTTVPPVATSTGVTSSLSIPFDQITTQSPKWYDIKNPSVGYVWIKIPEADQIDDKNLAGMWSEATKSFLDSAKGFLETRPENFKSFKFQRLLQGIGKFELVLFDKDWQVLEAKLVQAKGLIFFKYGYTESDDNHKSPWISAKVFSYSVKFALQGTTLILSGLATGFQLSTARSYDLESARTDDIGVLVEKIARAFDMDFVIEPTKPILTSSNDKILLTDLSMNLTKQGGVTSLEYIVRQLQPLAKSNESGRGGYGFYVEQNKNKSVLHFHTLTYSKEGKNYQIPTFTWFSNPNSPIISYEPTWLGSMYQLRGGLKTFSPIYRITDKTVEDILITQEQVSDPTPSTSNTAKETKPVKESDSTHVVIAGHCETTEGAQNEVNNEVTVKTMIPLQAKLRIIGTPKFNVTDPVAVMVYLPAGLITSINKSNSTKLHWSSGLFRVMGVTEFIEENGSYITELDLGTSGRSILAPDKRVEEEASKTSK